MSVPRSDARSAAQSGEVRALAVAEGDGVAIAAELSGPAGMLVDDAIWLGTHAAAIVADAAPRNARRRMVTDCAEGEVGESEFASLTRTRPVDLRVELAPTQRLHVPRRRGILGLAEEHTLSTRPSLAHAVDDHRLLESAAAERRQ